ncbi:HNH endonuclease signature motif containing protein [Nonomuraea recticatena]
MAKRRAADPEKHREIVRRQQQRPDWNERRRAAYAANPDRVRVKNARARARRANAEGTFTDEEWLAVVAHYENGCVACRAVGPLEPDHVVPLTWGGSNWISNIQPLCRSCNASKCNRHATDYRLAWSPSSLEATG